MNPAFNTMFHIWEMSLIDVVSIYLSTRTGVHSGISTLLPITAAQCLSLSDSCVLRSLCETDEMDLAKDVGSTSIVAEKDISVPC